MGFFFGLTVATHPEAALFAAVSISLIWVVKWRSLVALRGIPIAMAISVSWLVIILPRLGLDGIFQGILSRAGGLGDDSLRKVILLADLWPVTLMGLMGAAVALRFGKLRWLLGWAAACAVLPGAIGRWVAFPWAILAAVGVEPALDLNLRARWAIAAVAAPLTVGAVLTFQVPSVPPLDRMGMRDIATTVAPDLAYRVIGSPEIVEWFPYLAQHHSTTTDVGYEWVGGKPGEPADRVYLQGSNSPPYQ